MKRLGPCLILAFAAAPLRAGGSFRLPAFPTPALVRNEFGETKEIGFLGFLRELQRGGVPELDDVDFVDENYAVLESGSLGRLSGWLEEACRSLGVQLAGARRGPYDGSVFARLLEVATSLAALRRGGPPLAIPIGVAICRRSRPWGELPGDGARDAYLLIETERGLLVYDPPTRQLTPLADFPNSGEVVKVQF